MRLEVLLAQANKIYDNATWFNVEERVVDPHTAIDILLRAPRLWQQLTQSSDDDDKRLFFNVWRLCWDVTSCLVPFDSPDLKLKDRLSDINQEAHRYPAMRRQLKLLNDAVSSLLQVSTNPKGESVFNLIAGLIESGQSVGLIMRMNRTITPGWQEDFAQRFEALIHGCELIKTRRDLLDSTLDSLVVPGNGKRCPFRTDLYALYRSRRLIIVRYARERSRPPLLPKLPNGTVNKAAPKVTGDSATSRPQERTGLDDWITDQEWELTRLRADRATDGRASSDFLFVVRARLVLLESGDAVYLQEERKVIEVSPLLSDTAAGAGTKLPRKYPKELRSGDLIGLRTSGSGDYLEVVADELLRKAGRSDLRTQCTDWKVGLLKLLKCFGAQDIAERLAVLGTVLSSYNYPWHWATGDVIRPQHKGTFANLIRVIAELGELPKTLEIDTYIDKRWIQMKELIGYHHKAGLQIRRALLQRLFELLETSTALNDDQVALRLPDVDAGEITLFRVAAVDGSPSEVPYTRLNSVF